MESRRKPLAAFARAGGWPLALLAALAWLGCGGEEVAVTRAVVGEIQESFSEPGRTRLEKTWLIAMPVAGRIGRIDLEPGDAVKAGEPLVQYDLVPFSEAAAEAAGEVSRIRAAIAVKSYNGIEDTLLLEAREWIRATAELLKASDEEVAAEQARSDRSDKELARMRELAASKAIAESTLDDARLEADTALIQLKKQMFNRAAVNIMSTIVAMGPRTINDWLGLKSLQMEELTHSLAQAESRLARAEHALALTSVKSPIEGVVLERYEQGEAPLPAGTPLLLVGDLALLEVEVDVLTNDALRLRPGTPVILTAAAEAVAAEGHVKRIEPQGFTKLSSLGVEQQRVKTIVSLDSKSDKLGAGYRVQTRFLTASRDAALKVPRYSVMQDRDRSYYVFKVANGRLARTAVAVGLRSDLELEVTSGLAEGDVIAAQPDTTMSHGQKVRVKRSR